MLTILLDIDGTLVRTGGAGLAAIQTVMKRHYSVDKLPQVEVHGCTDFGIWNSIFDQLAIPIPDDITFLIDEYCQLLEQNLGTGCGQILPGVENCLSRLSERDDVAMGLLTGNAEQAARIKMKFFGLDGFVREFGGFGDLYADRDMVARLSMESAKAHLGTAMMLENVWVIGDTVRDIKCARAVGAKVLAVATGGDDIGTLAASEPDAQMVDLSNFVQLSVHLGL